jgi:tryptophanyl-tRNA synthetase
MADSSKKASKSDPASQQKFNDDLKQMKDKILELSNNVTSAATVDALAQKQAIDAYLAKLGASNLDDMQQLWEAGQNLSLLLGNLLDQVRGAVEEQRSAKLSDRAKAALDLNDMLAGLENIAKTDAPPVKAISADDLDKLFNDISSIRVHYHFLPKY